MHTNKLSAYLLIWWTSIILILLIAWLLGAFHSDPKIIVPNIQTNKIVEHTISLPESCQNTLALMNCIMTSPSLSGASENLWQSYAQLISEWNVITDPQQLDATCMEHYTYLLSLEDTTYQQVIQSCQQQ